MLGHHFFSIDQDEGISEVTFELNASPVDPDILRVNVVISILVFVGLAGGRVFIVGVLVGELILVLLLRGGHGRRSVVSPR